MKTCFKCGAVKPLTAFYKHPKMADGRVNKCKECNKRDVRENRKDKVEYYRAYDQARGCRVSPEYIRERRKKFPKQHKAHNIVSNAIRDGKLFRDPCEVCGERRSVHAHHDDYAKPLNVRWLCAAHHIQWHLENGPGDNRK